MPLTLADFDSSRLIVETLALLESDGPPTLWDGPGFGGEGVILAGDLVVETSAAEATRIDRIRQITHSGQTKLVLQDDNEPNAVHLLDYFSDGGDGDDLRIYLQTETGGTVSILANDHIETGVGGPEWVRFQNLPAAFITVLESLADGVLFNFALARPASRPDAPTGLSATAAGRTAIDLSWDAPANDGGVAITGYGIAATEDGIVWQTLVSNHPDTSYRHSGLAPSSTRRYQVRAVNAVGESNWSAEASATTAALSAPTAPTGLTATPAEQINIDLAWDAPADDGGAAITGYELEVSEDGSTWTQLVASQAGTSYRHAVGGAGLTRHYRVRAINSEGSGDWSSVAMATTPGSQQQQPALTLADFDQTGLEVEVLALIESGAPPELYRDSDSGGSDTVEAGELTFALADGSAEVTISRIRRVVQSDVTKLVILEADQPDAVNILTYFSDGGDGEDLSLYLQTQAGGVASVVVNDYLEPGTTSSNWIRIQNLPADFLTILNSLADGTLFNFALARPAAPTEPGAPQSLTATADGQTEIDLSWDAPASDGGAAVTGYEIEVSPDGSSWSQLVASQAGRTYSHTSLAAGTTRHYRVRAINSVGSGDWSSVAMATTDAATAPGAPRNLTATANGQAQIDLAWDAPSSNGGAAITGYRIEVSSDGGSNWSQLVASQAGTTYSHTSLSGGTTRHYRVRAINSVGPGGWSATASATTDAAFGLTDFNSAGLEVVALALIEAGGAQDWLGSSDTAEAGDLTFETDAAEASTVSVIRWLTADEIFVLNDNDVPDTVNLSTYFRSGGDGDDLSIYLQTAAGGVQSFLGSDYTENGGPHWLRFHNLPAAFVTLADTISSGTRFLFALARPAPPTTTAPGAPRNLSAAAAGQTAIDLSWDAPTSDGGAAITGYEIEVSSNAGTSWTQLVASQAGRTYRHSSLAAGTTRHYRVRAINSEGSGDWSAVAMATTASAPVATAPGAPRNLVAMAMGQTQIDLSWDAPASDGGAAVTGYRIEVSTNAGGSWSQLVASHPSRSYFHTGLDPSTTRHYRVRAINSVGGGAWSATAMATTDDPATLLISSTPTLIAQRLVPGSLTISESLQRRTICTFRLLLEPDTTWPGLSIGQPIQIRDSGGTLLFAGSVDSDDSDELLVGEGPLEQSVTAVDYTQIFDRFTVGADYQDMLAGDVVRDILTNPASSSIAGEVGAGRRITLGTIVDGPRVTVVFPYSSVRSALDELSELTGLTWLLSPGGEFSFRARSAGTSRTVDFAGLRLSRSRSRQLLRNRQYVRGGKGLSGVRRETFRGDSTSRSFSLAYPVGAVPTITLDGEAQTVGIRGVEVEKQWYWSQGDPEITQESGHATLRTGAVLEVRYRFEFPILSILNDSSSQASRRGAEGGTGLYELLETDDRIPSPGLAVERARGLLRRHGSPEEHLTVTADDALGPASLLAARPGDLIAVRNSRLHIDAQYLVESAETRDLEGLHLEKSWELSGGEAYGGWTQFFQNLAAARAGELSLREGEGVQLARSAGIDEVTITDSVTVTTESAVIGRVGSARVGFFEVQ